MHNAFTSEIVNEKMMGEFWIASVWQCYTQNACREYFLVYLSIRTIYTTHFFSHLEKYHGGSSI